jgi:hypothetical protein
MKIIRLFNKSFLYFLMILLPIVAAATIVTASQVAQAILNSPNASAQLKQYANSVGNLALNVESSGNTTASNSCCYGILQLDATNIRNLAGITPAQYLQLDLQDQVNVWASYASPLLNSSQVKQLESMGTLGGRTVDGALILGCIQLGSGNCQDDIDANSCNAALDGNKKSICYFADKIDGVSTSNTGSSSNSNGNTGNSSGSSNSSQIDLSCVKDENGNCLGTDEAVKQGFESGSGMGMSALKTLIKGGVLSIIILILTINIVDTFTLYTKGVIHQHVLLRVAVQNLISIALIITLMTIFG